MLDERRSSSAEAGRAVPAVRAVRPDGERQRRRRRGQRRRGLRRRSTPRRAIRSPSPPTRTRRPTRPTATTPSRCTPRSTGRSRGDERLRRHGQRRARRSSTRRTPSRRPYDAASNGNVVQTAQLDLGQAAAERQGRARARLRRHPGRGRRRRRGARSAPHVRQVARRSYEAGWQAYDDSLNEPPPRSSPASRRQRSGSELERRVLPERQRAQGLARTRPSPARSSPAWPRRGGRRSRPATRTTPTSAPTARCSPAISTRPGPASWPTATSPPPGPRRCSCSSASSCPTARCRATAWSTASWRPTRSATQLDEVAYPILMAAPARADRRLALREPHQAGGELRRSPTARVRRRALGGAGRATRRRRSRPRSPGCSPRPTWPTPTATPCRPRVWRGVADDYQRSIKGWTVTTNGPLAAHPYFIRLSKTGDPNAAITYNVGNGGPTLDQRAVIDAGFLELARLGELARDRCRRRRSRSRWSTRRSRRRHGERARLAPLQRRRLRRPRRATAGRGRRSGQGTGHLWPVLVGRARRAVARRPATRPAAASLLDGMAQFASGVGLIPEQDWEVPRSGRLAVRHRPDGGVDRLRQRQAGRLGVAAHLVGRRLRPAVRRHRRGRARRPARRHRSRATSPTRRARRRSRSRARPTTRPSPVAGHGRRHDRARQPGLRLGHQHRRQLATTTASATAAADGSFSVRRRRHAVARPS